MRSDLTLYEYTDQWLRLYKRNSVKPSTYERLRVSLHTMGDYRIARIPVSDIYPQDIQDYFDDLVRDGYSITTIKKQACVVTAPLRHAAAVREIYCDPTTDLRLPSPSAARKAKKDVEAYSKDEQSRLLSVLGNDIYSNAIRILLETGLRIGELLALDWSDVNWDSQSLTISKTIINPASTGTSRVQNSPKSLSSRRVIPMSSTCYEILTMLRNQNGSIHVLGTGDRRMSYKAFVKHTKSFCWKAGIPYKGTHVFRHTFATNCYYRGCNVKLLSKLLGHANPSITYAIYINLYGDALEEMRSVLG